MKKDYLLFDFQEFIGKIREDVMGKGDNVLKELLDSITDEMGVEDMPFYKEYLADFDVNWLFGKFKLRVAPEIMFVEADYELLVRLVCASFSSSYDFVCDKENKEVEMRISVSREGKSVGLGLHELRTSQISMLFCVFLEEQLDWESLRMKSLKEKVAVDAERILKGIVYEEKKGLVESQLGSVVILSDRDELLNSN